MPLPTDILARQADLFRQDRQLGPYEAFAMRPPTPDLLPHEKQEDIARKQADFFKEEGYTPPVYGSDAYNPYMDIEPMTREEFRASRPRRQPVARAAGSVAATVIFGEDDITLTSGEKTRVLPYFCDKGKRAVAVDGHPTGIARRDLTWLILNSPGCDFGCEDLLMMVKGMVPADKPPSSAENSWAGVRRWWRQLRTSLDPVVLCDERSGIARSNPSLAVTVQSTPGYSPTGPPLPPA